MNILAYIILVVVLCSIFFFIDTASTEIYTLSLHDALPICFRPIMMTTMAALLGAVPLALGTGTGSELRRPLGIAIIGGLILSQMLTLYTTPVIYLWFERLARRFSRKHEEDQEPGTELAPARP